MTTFIVLADLKTFATFDNLVTGFMKPLSDFSVKVEEIIIEIFSTICTTSLTGLDFLEMISISFLGTSTIQVDVFKNPFGEG